MTPQAEAILRGRLVKACHPKQRAYVLDTSLRKSACCSRRAGKSVSELVQHALTSLDYPGEQGVYIGRSVAAARDVLVQADRALKRMGIDLGVKVWTRGRTYWRLPSGYALWVAGCDDRSQIDDFRGQKYARASVDEAQQVPFLVELLEEALEPALMDLRGSLDLIGTPSAVPFGAFFDASQGAGGWSAHHWTVHDNPHIPEVDAVLAGVLQRRGWTEQTPRFRREYLGQWVLDGEALVYGLTRARNGWTQIPVGTRRRVLGVDLGSTGTTAFVLVTTVQDTPGYWVEHCETATGLSVSDVCDRVRALRDEWQVWQVVVDAGGLGGAYVAELRNRYRINAEAAKKTEKLAYIEHIRSDITAGLLHVADSAQAVWDEASTLQWNEKHTGYDDRMADHALDALLYAWRYLRPEYEPVLAAVLEPGSPEWFQREQREARRQREREVLRRQRERR